MALVRVACRRVATVAGVANVSRELLDDLQRPARLRPWRAASSMADVGELTARWLEGRVLEQPGYCGPVDVDEDQAPGLTSALVMANRRGLWTTNSQAGYREQLAWVSGWAAPGLVQYLASAAEDRDVEVVVFGWMPHENSGGGYVRRESRLVVTWDGGRPFTVDSGRRDDAYWLAEWVQPSAVAELRAMVPVAIVDPVAGRNTLWAWLEETLQGIYTGWPSPLSEHLAPAAPVLPVVPPRGPAVGTAAGLAVTSSSSMSSSVTSSGGCSSWTGRYRGYRPCGTACQGGDCRVVPVPPPPTPAVAAMARIRGEFR